MRAPLPDSRRLSIMLTFESVRYGQPLSWGQYVEDDTARDLLRGMLHPDPADRLTVDAALAHPWLRNEDAATAAAEKPEPATTVSTRAQYCTSSALARMFTLVVWRCNEAPRVASIDTATGKASSARLFPRTESRTYCRAASPVSQVDFSTFRWPISSRPHVWASSYLLRQASLLRREIAPVVIP